MGAAGFILAINIFVAALFAAAFGAVAWRYTGAIGALAFAGLWPGRPQLHSRLYPARPRRSAAARHHCLCHIALGFPHLHHRIGPPLCRGRAVDPAWSTGRGLPARQYYPDQRARHGHTGAGDDLPAALFLRPYPGGHHRLPGATPWLTRCAADRVPVGQRAAVYR
ncbi:hypothetical protein N8D56_05315 [Devosia sp. A8/3-2]|nr:hypothetical protein N8D56_05315 [Devosia sp. A8/3-2]